MTEESPLGLRIPEQSQSSLDSFLLDPDALRSWITDLPLANVGETSRRTFKAIVDCNRILMAPAKRVKLAELLRPTHAYVTENLEKHYLDAAFPLSPKNRKIAVLNRELHAEMAICYKIAVRDLLTGDKGPTRNKLVVYAIHRALFYLDSTLLRSYLAYEPAPEGVWQEIHRLAAYAFENQLHLTPVKTGKDRKSTSTINDVYIHILLLALLTPYKLRQREMLALAGKITEWTDRARLLEPNSLPEIVDDKGLFFSDLWSDTPPLHYSLRSSRPCKKSILLNASRLLRHLKKLADRPTEQAGDAGDSILTPLLMRRLIHAWSRASKRRYARTRLHFQLKVASGLNAIHDLMTVEEAGAKHPTSAAKVGGERKDSEGKEQTDMLQHVLKSGFLQTGNSSDLSLSPLDAAASMGTSDAGKRTALNNTPGEDTMKNTLDVWSSHNPVSHEIHVLRTLNESAGGYCVSWTGHNIPRITIGELIGIQSAADTHQFGIATVRWMKNDPDEGLRLGLQMLAPRATRVEARNDERAEAGAQHCLLLPGLKTTSMPSSLITPALAFQQGALVTLIAPQGGQQVRLTRQLETTSAFCRFLFTPVTSADENEPRPADDQFESLWQHL